MAETKDKARTAADAWLIGAAAWAFPGAGHYLQGKWLRGLLITLVVCGMFAIGLAFGGHLFGLGGKEALGASKLLQLPPTIANLGTGILYLVCWASNSGFNDSAEYAKLATFEYGNTFLLVAGLLNYLAMLDAFDIAVGRKP
ncbi:MAG: hypothetical protein DMF68_00060 [Acidobacteria bacterium]|nr:MAG: hypothetical protein DMF68_00060 [Acidobacteriota bacterium]